MLQAHDRPKRCVHVRPQPAPNSLFPTKSILHTRQLINRQHTSHQPFTVLLLKQGPPWTPPPHHQNCKQEKKVTSDGGLPAPFRSNYGCPFGFSLFPTFNFRVVACQINSSETAAYLLPSPSTPDQPKKEKYQQFHQKKRSQKVVNFLIFLPPPIIFWMKPSSSSSSEVLFGFPTFKMGMCQHDPDVLRWGLDQLVDVCSPGNNGSPQTITGYDKDFSQVAYVKEGYCENDETIARAYQEELSRLAAVESMRSSNPNQEHQQESVLAQDWYGSSDCQRAQDAADEVGLFKVCSSPGGTAGAEDDELGSPEIEDDSILDGEVGKRLNQMCPVPHVPKINGEIPSADEATSDHQRLLDRLQLYDLIELKVSGDGNCQFRSLSDQIYRTPEHHKFVRQQVVDQLKSRPELYEGYVPMPYDEYLKRMTKNGEWGDHVTLQAAADAYGVRIFVITSFKDTCYIEILPQVQKSDRVITLSFWAEVHYNSIYPPGEYPVLETKKKKKWWWPVAMV